MGPEDIIIYRGTNMIGEVDWKNKEIETFICYRSSGKWVGAAILAAMEREKEWDYERVWYSQKQGAGNYVSDIPLLLGSAKNVIIVFVRGFTYDFFKDGQFNENCVTAKELAAIDRRYDEIKIVPVYIDNYVPDESEISTIADAILAINGPRYFRDKETIMKFWGYKNRVELDSEKVASEAEMDMWLDKNLRKELSPKIIAPVETISYFKSDDYDDMFRQLLRDENKYQNMAYFGYGGSVFKKDLFGGSIRYNDIVSKKYKHKSIRILLRDPDIEEMEEKIDNARPEVKRPRNKSEGIRDLIDYYRKNDPGLDMEIRFYEHHPILKGCIFCDAEWNPKVGLINIESAYGEKYQKSGGSPFKGDDSDMIFINAETKENGQATKMLKAILSQFNYEWNKGKKAIK